MEFEKLKRVRTLWKWPIDSAVFLSRCYIALKRNRDNQKEAAAFLKKMMKGEVTAKSAVDSVKNTEEKTEEQIIKDIGKLKQDKGKTCDPSFCADFFSLKINILWGKTDLTGSLESLPLMPMSVCSFPFNPSTENQ